MASALSAAQDYIDQLLRWNRPNKERISSFDFARLPQFFPESLLARVSAVVVDQIPLPEEAAFGCNGLLKADGGEFVGMTYLDTYFIKSGYEMNEAVHFHELVHVIQWLYLGFDRFMDLYMTGMLRYGYRNCPVEAIAYHHQARFEAGAEPYDVAAEVCGLLHKLVR